MAKGLITGARTSFDDQTDEIIQVEDGIKFLNPADNGIKFIKKLIDNRNGKVARSWKYNWDETDLPVRKETVSIAADDTNPITVANAKAYHVGDIIRCENEIMRVTALASGTTLTVTRGYAGSSAAAHSSKVLMNLGVAAAENSTGVAAITTTAARLYNYVQQFEDAVELSTIEMGTMSSDGSRPFDRQLERITLSFWKRFAQAVFYNPRYEDSGNKLHTMGGLDVFLSSNVTNVAGALTQTAIDNGIYASVLAGGNIDTMVLHPYQKRKLDALDNNLQMLGKRERTGGGLITNTWQSGVLDHEIDVIVDHTVGLDEVRLIDSSTLSIIPFEGQDEESGKAIDGRLSVVDATLPGQSGKKKLLRGYYTLQAETEAANVKLYGLT